MKVPPSKAPTTKTRGMKREAGSMEESVAGGKENT